jgi:hypothetical protein
MATTNPLASTEDKLFENIASAAGAGAASALVPIVSDPKFQERMAKLVGSEIADKVLDKFSPMMIASIFVAGFVVGGVTVKLVT